MRWPEGLNTPYLLLFCPFLSLFLVENQVFLCFSLAFLGFPLFHFLFLCLSLFLFFVPSFLSFSLLLSFGSLFLSLSFFLFLLCFCFMNRTTSNYSITKLLSHQSFLFLGWFPLFLFFQIPFPYLCFFFPDFKFIFSTSMFSLKMQVKNTNFWSREGLQHNVFCL